MEKLINILNWTPIGIFTVPYFMIGKNIGHEYFVIRGSVIGSQLGLIVALIFG